MASSSSLPEGTEETPIVRRRGRAKCIRVNSHSGDRIPIACNIWGQPIKKTAGVLSSYLGTLARDSRLCPLNVPNWHKLPISFKNDIVSIVEKKFCFHIKGETLDAKAVRRIILMSVAHKVRDYRCKLRKDHYRDNESKEQNISKFPPGVDRAHWIFLVDHFAGPDKVLHDSGKRSRELQTLLHYTGRKSFAREYDEIAEKNGVEPGPLEKFKATHTKKSTNALSEDAAVIVETIESKVTEMSQDPNYSHRDVSDLQREALIGTLGPERPGRLRGYGLGVTQSMVFGSHRTSRVDNSEAIRKMKALEEENDRMKQTQLLLQEENAQMKRAHQELTDSVFRLEQLVLSQASNRTSLEASSRSL